MSQRRCMGCMALTEKPVCEHCGSPAEVCNEPHQLPVGTLLREQYQVGRVLGQGGFGITYLGWDTYLDTPVAIKEYYPNSLVNRESTQSLSVHCYTETVAPAYTASMERFLREAKALAKFDDEPAIVRIKSFFPENGTAYIVMEYVRGTALHKYVAMRGGRLSLEETLRILKPVMDALDTVHKTGMIHRDISPDNIILHPKGGAKLLDFGAVRSVENPDADKALTQSTEAILKHGFAPMEQYQNKGSLGPWTDVYALCATIYYCVTGRVPEDAPARMMEERDPDWSGVSDITQKQKQALEKGMALRTTRRTASVDELIRDLYEETDFADAVKESFDARQKEESSVIEEKQQIQKEIWSEQRQQKEKLWEMESALQTEKDDSYTRAASRRKTSQKHYRSIKIRKIIIIAAAVALVLVIGFFTFTKTGWYMENGHRVYYTRLEGKLRNTWLQEGEGRYYFDDQGHVKTGFFWFGDDLYYVGENEFLAKGWVLEADYLYYCEDYGRVVTGLRTIDGYAFSFDDEGKLCGYGWKHIDGSTYFLQQGGVISKGWKNIGGDQYYFGTDGVMLTGWQTINGDRYYLGTDGIMYTGWQTINGNRYYFGADGVMCTGGKVIGGSYYYFDDYGRLFQ